ncbi:MAG: hypothetical protein V4550_05100 [Gemmatimonadota bacterium]
MPLLVSALVALQLSAANSALPQLSAETLLARARSARFQQDSLLGDYRATVRQRMSSGLGVARGFMLGAIARDRLAARFESVARVGWNKQHGAWAELIAARAVVPMDGMVKPESVDEDVGLVFPYAPGRDRLWPTAELSDALPMAKDWITHPLAAGADSLYLFEVGDSLNLRFPDGKTIRVRELRVHPRRPASHLIVGSLWVDSESGSLVRAAYRPSTPVDLWPFMEREIGRNDRDKVKTFGPFTGTIREIIVEHGLYAGRFWLPRIRIAEGEGTAKGGRITMSIEQTFTYESVSAIAPGAPVLVAQEPPSIDPRDGRIRRPKWRGVEQRTQRCRPTGDSTSAAWSPESLMVDKRLTIMTVEGMRTSVLLPCDVEAMATSPLLPPSIYSPSEELFTESDLSAIRKEVQTAFALSNQAAWHPQPRTLSVGIDRGLWRYNRIEGLSGGVAIEQVLGNGYDAGLIAHVGLADRQPNAELFLQRASGRAEIRAAAYRRLDAANDWGSPLGLGASVSAALFGRDDGFYYRSLGAEARGTFRSAPDAPAYTWRIFAEQQSTAKVGTDRSIANAVNGSQFTANITAREGIYAGSAGGIGFTSGVDPRGLRVTGGVRAEAALGESTYGRGTTELTIGHGLGGDLEATVSGGAGSSLGTVPAQRLWYLGGPHTVHAYVAGDARGDAFWMGRAELAKGNPLIRPRVFADVGWAGPRADITRATQRLSSAGIGVALLDGLFRADASRKLRGSADWRVDLYVDAR